ncbi:sialate O-acetylesterase, partial [Escherichia coli]|nr:sialate O-acetylesterase [Escherichia coli]MCE9767166.1 sialate O-acetylesterase [Escherichia coli]
EGDVTTPVVVQPSGDGGAVISTTSEPEYYFVIALAGQSNSMSFGEGLPLPETYDRPDPRIKQLARRSTVTPGGVACKYND